MHLFLKTSEFVWHGLQRSGVPFLCDDTMELVDAPNQYLRYVATVRGWTRALKRPACVPVSCVLSSDNVFSEGTVALMIH